MKSARRVSDRMSAYYIFLQIKTSMLFCTQHEKDIMETIASSLRDEKPAQHLKRCPSSDVFESISLPRPVRSRLNFNALSDKFRESKRSTPFQSY